MEQITITNEMTSQEIAEKLSSFTNENDITFICALTLPDAEQGNVVINGLEPDVYKAADAIITTIGDMIDEDEDEGEEEENA